MQVTRDVILDLLPIYCAGEVTTDTRSLVEEFLRTDAELATQAAEIRRALRSVEIAAPRRGSPDADLRALKRVRSAVRLRGTLLGMSIFFTCLIFSFTFDNHGVYWTWARFPLGAVIAGAVALVSWVGYFRLRRRLGV
jgi:anti-sigma factor RsiW